MGFRLGQGNDEESMSWLRRQGFLWGWHFRRWMICLMLPASEELGKDAAHDAESGKVTWVGLLGEQKARELAEKHTRDASEKLTGVGGNNTFVLELANRMLDRKN